MKILFVGDLNWWTRSYQRYTSFLSLDVEVDKLSSAKLVEVSDAYRASFLEKVMWKLKLPVDSEQINKKIVNLVNKVKYDLIWIEKGNTIKPATLRYIKSKSADTIMVSCAEDNMYLFHNHTLYYQYGLRYYDLIFTTKVQNVYDLKKFGANKIVLFLDSYDEALFRPMTLNEEDYERYHADVGFIGTFEKARAEFIYHLAENGIKVRIYGDGWSKWKGHHNNLVIKGYAIRGKEYVQAINATKINLCFLRKLNYDVATGRSMEITACGAFMLAERTDRHLSLFQEDEEAVFFSTKKELIDKVMRYLEDDQARNKIAYAGRQRCTSSGYSSGVQFKNMFDEVFKYKELTQKKTAQ